MRHSMLRSRLRATAWASKPRASSRRGAGSFGPGEVGVDIESLQSESFEVVRDPLRGFCRLGRLLVLGAWWISLGWGEAAAARQRVVLGEVAWLGAAVERPRAASFLALCSATYSSSRRGSERASRMRSTRCARARHRPARARARRAARRCRSLRAAPESCARGSRPSAARVSRARQEGGAPDRRDRRRRGAAGRDQGRARHGAADGRRESTAAARHAPAAGGGRCSSDRPRR